MPDGDSPERVLLDSYPFQSPLKCSRPQPLLFPVLCTPFRSAAPSLISVLLRRVRSRSSRMSRGGMQLPSTSPCRSNPASHRLSLESVFLPLNSLTCIGFAKMIFTVPSKTLYTGFQ